MEIAPGIHLISGMVGVRPLQLYLLTGKMRCILVDTGCAHHPNEIVFPYLRQFGLHPHQIDMVINTHCDMDHCGGNSALKSANPNVEITCGEQDRALVENPQLMWDLRYNAYFKDHGIHYDATTRAEIFNAMGNPQPVDLTWSGGERIDLGDEWYVEIHHTPGHSSGHLAILDLRSRTLLSGDAVHGSMYPDLQGQPSLCPTYLEVDSYVSTIRYLESLQIDCLAGCHWPLQHGKAVGQFLAESLEFVDRAESAVVASLRQNPEGLTLRDLISNVGPSLGAWPRRMDAELVYAIDGHLKLLLAEGRIVADRGVRPVVFRLAPN
jgi:glyoxylase-like metal-dependent hydrolase (beta-lactamase superfamily II)